MCVSICVCVCVCAPSVSAVNISRGYYEGEMKGPRADVQEETVYPQ